MFGRHFPVLWIREILVRIRFRRSVPGTTDIGFGSCSFRQWLLRCQQKVSFFLLINFLRHIYIILHRQKVIKKSQNSRNQVFLTFFCLMTEGSGSRSGPVQRMTNPNGPKITDLDPQHRDFLESITQGFFRTVRMSLNVSCRKQVQISRDKPLHRKRELLLAWSRTVDMPVPRYPVAFRIQA
jgi:hypothetical protein